MHRVGVETINIVSMHCNELAPCQLDTLYGVGMWSQCYFENLEKSIELGSTDLNSVWLVFLVDMLFF